VNKDEIEDFIACRAFTKQVKDFFQKSFPPSPSRSEGLVVN